MDPLAETCLKQLRADRYISLQYSDLIESAGLTVVSEKDFGDYQGDLVFHLVQNTPEGAAHGILIQGYGSCSGCDALEAATPSFWDLEDADEHGHHPDLENVFALRDQMVASVAWHGTEAWEKITSETENTDWWYFDEELGAHVRELAKQIDAVMAPAA